MQGNVFMCLKVQSNTVERVKATHEPFHYKLGYHH